MKNKTFFYCILALLLFSVGACLGMFQMFLGANKMYYTAAGDSSVIVTDNVDDVYSSRYIFTAVKMIIDKNYVEKIDAELYNEMSVDLAKGMLRELGDSACRYADKKEVELIEKANLGEFEGIGIKPEIRTVDVDGIRVEKLFVGSVIPQGPAYKAGIQAGDVIELIDGQEILPYNPLAKAEKILKEYQLKPDRSKLKEVQAQIDKEYERIEKGLPILEAERKISYKSKDPIKIKTNINIYTLTPSSWTLEPAKQATFNGVPYLEVQCLTEKTGEKVGEIISNFKAAKKDFFVLDLRDVFGGTYDSAKEVAKFFVPNTSLGTLKTKKSSVNLLIPKNDAPWRGKLIILVNKGTNKYGELLANAISQDSSSVIVGEETLGDFKDISIYDFDNGGGFTLTTGEYILVNKAEKVSPQIQTECGPNGKEINKSVIDKALSYVGGAK
ncbi:MAG: PDZ domain-containing protein [Abditibacteriota bacterium]|nr:PDZ domain-containing protein [Abditibacteriota bacterium]